MTRSRGGRDEGLAVVVALMLTLVVFILTTLILADAFHNVAGSANSRERLTAVNAAEAGLSWFVSTAEDASSSTSALVGGADWTLAGTRFVSQDDTFVSGAPNRGAFRLSVGYFLSYDPSLDGSVVDGSVDDGLSGEVTTFDDSTVSETLFAEVWSEGMACRSEESDTECQGWVSRTLRAIVELHPAKSPLNGAFAGMYVCELGNRFTIRGPASDVYLLAPAGGGVSEQCKDDSNLGGPTLLVKSGYFQTDGNVFVLEGGVSLQTSTKIDGDLTALGGITLGGGTSNPRKKTGSGTGSCSTANFAILICGDATSKEGAVSELLHAKVLGTKTSNCSSCQLPSPSFPTVLFNNAKNAFPTWPSAVSLPNGITDFWPSAGTDNQLFTRETCSAPLVMASGTLTLTHDLAIVSKCGFTFGNRVEIRPSGPGIVRTLYLITASDGVTATDCLTKKFDMTFSQNLDASGIRLYVFTPCRLLFNNQTTVTGQLLGRTLYAQGQTTINTLDLVGAPGMNLGTVSGFRPRVLSIREI